MASGTPARPVQNRRSTWAIELAGKVVAMQNFWSWLGHSRKSWSLGPMSFAYDMEDVKRYKAEQEAARKAGKLPGL